MTSLDISCCPISSKSWKIWNFQWRSIEKQQIFSHLRSSELQNQLLNQLNRFIFWPSAKQLNFKLFQFEVSLHWNQTYQLIKWLLSHFSIEYSQSRAEQHQMPHECRIHFFLFSQCIRITVPFVFLIHANYSCHSTSSCLFVCMIVPSLPPKKKWRHISFPVDLPSGQAGLGERERGD